MSAGTARPTRIRDKYDLALPMSFSFERMPVICICLATLAAGSIRGEQEAAPERVVISFDFESQFDDGVYGKKLGDMFWQKLNRQGEFVIPESMLDVRDIQQRHRLIPNHETSLETMRRLVRDEFGADIGIWGKIERVAGHQWDVYDLWIKIVDFSEDNPRTVYQTQVRTKTVSEIPHVYVKEALEQLYGQREEVAEGPDLEAERRWREGPNLVRNGGFEEGTPHPASWDPLPEYVSLVTVPDAQDSGGTNRVVRFQFPASVADTTGVLYYSDYFPVQEDVTYRFQCRFRTTGSQVKVFIKCYDELGTRYELRDGGRARYELREVYRSQQNLAGARKVWHVHTQDFTPRHAKYSPSRGRVMLYAYHPAGTVDFDDIVVKQISPH
jgi:hypothetical protein